MKNNLEQAWKEEARKAYQDQQSQDNEGGCREPVGFVQGYLAAKKSDFEEIESWKDQANFYEEDRNGLNQEIKTLKEQLESANAVIYHVVYSTEDSQGLAYGYLEENSLLKQNKEINNEK